MAAQIIEKNTEAFKTVDVDPITLDLIENALKNAREEMDATLFRTAMSPGIREQGDAFPLIADHTGLMLAGQFGSFIQGFLENYDDEIDGAMCSGCPTLICATAPFPMPMTGWSWCPSLLTTGWLAGALCLAI